MPTDRVDVCIAQVAAAAHFNGFGTKYLVQTPSGVLYMVFVDTQSDLAWSKSTDGGISWSEGVVIFAGTVSSFAIWYDRWSNISAGLIHCAYAESGTHDTLYRTINTESSDALSTQTVIFAGASAIATGSFISITRAIGGNVYCRTQIDAGTEGGFYRLPTANVPNGAWDAARTINEANATLDQIILVPGFAADNQDIMGIFWDASANQISRQIYDDSANSWAESIFGAPDTYTEQATNTNNPHYAAAVDLTNSQIVVIAWNAIDTANADLRCLTVTESAITQKTDVITNSTDDQGLAALCIDTNNYWWAFRFGISTGGETFATSVHLYVSCSTDSGSTWGPETQLTNVLKDAQWLATVPVMLTPGCLPPPASYIHNTSALDRLMVNTGRTLPHARLQLGI